MTAGQRDRYDVIIIGLGAMGSSAADHLARRGVRVLGLEQHSIPHGLGSSHGYSRMIRQAYFEHPDYVPLILRAYENWFDLERRSGQELLTITSALYLGRAEGTLVGGALKAAKQHGLRHELLGLSEVRKRYPQFQVPDDYAGFVEPMAGFLRPERVIAAAAEQALRNGAELHGNEGALGWDAEGGTVRVRTERATYEGARLIVTAGAWTDRILRDLGAPLKVTRQTMGWFWPRTPDAFELGRFPCWSVEHDGGGIHYGFPMTAENPGFKIANHDQGEPTDPDRVDRSMRDEDEQDLRCAIERHIPAASGPLLAGRVCLYTNSPDGNFIIDRHPKHRHVALACGFSGHGFKFSSVVGEILADLATAGATKLPTGFLGLSRFTIGQASA